MISLLIALTLLTAQPKDAERARTQSNRRTRAERKAEVPVPPPAPGASSAVQIPVTGSAVDPTGRKYTFSGIVTLTLEDAPTPPVTVPTITGVRAPGSTAFVTEALSGASLELVGTGLPTGGQLRLTVGGLTAVVKQWTPTAVSFTAPLVAAPLTGPTVIYAQINNTWTPQATGPKLTIKPATVEVPALPRVDRFLALDGTAPDAFQIHQPVLLQGTGFGAQKGRVLVNWLETTVLSWSPTEIKTTAGDGTDPDGTQWQILCPAGWLHARGPRITMP
jgi:hypothetical protein